MESEADIEVITIPTYVAGWKFYTAQIYKNYCGEYDNNNDNADGNGNGNAVGSKEKRDEDAILSTKGSDKRTHIEIDLVGESRKPLSEVSFVHALLTATIEIRRELNNAHDQYAIQLWSEKFQLGIGHIPARVSKHLAYIIDSGLGFVQIEVCSAPNNEDQSDEVKDESSAKNTSQFSFNVAPNINIQLHVYITQLLQLARNDQHLARYHLSELREYEPISDEKRNSRYVRFLLRMGEVVLPRYCHLFTSMEYSYWNSFLLLPTNAQRLYCNLLFRKQCSATLMEQVSSLMSSSLSVYSSTAAPSSRWFLVDSLRYKNVDNTEAAIEILSSGNSHSQKDGISSFSDFLLDLPSKLPLFLENPSFAADFLSKNTIDMPTFRQSVPVTPKLHHEALTASTLTCPSEVKSYLLIERSDDPNLLGPDLYQSLIPSLPLDMVKELTSKLGIKIKSTTQGASFVRYSLLNALTMQRGINGKLLCNDIAIQKCFQRVCGRLVRLEQSFLLLCARIYRLYFLSTDMDMSLTMSPTPMILEEIGRVKYARPVTAPNDLANPKSIDLPKNSFSLPSAGTQIFPTTEAFDSFQVASELLHTLRTVIEIYEHERSAVRQSGELGEKSTKKSQRMVTMEVALRVSLLCISEAWYRLKVELSDTKSTESKSFDALLQKIKDVCNESGPLRDESLLFSRPPPSSRDPNTIELESSISTSDLLPELKLPNDMEKIKQSFQPCNLAQPSEGLIQPQRIVMQFSLHFRAVYVYALCCHIGLDVLEKQGYHTQAICLLYTLLGTPYCPQYRGTWWNRLMINLATHAQNKPESLRIGLFGLADTTVRTGDRVELYRRVKKLCNVQVPHCLEDTTTADTSVSKKRSRSKKKPSSNPTRLLEIVLSGPFTSSQFCFEIDKENCRQKLLIPPRPKKVKTRKSSARKKPRNSVHGLVGEEDEGGESMSISNDNPNSSLDNDYEDPDRVPTGKGLTASKTGVELYSIWEPGEVTEALSFMPTVNNMVKPSELVMPNSSITIQYIYGRPLNKSTGEKSHFVSWDDSVGSVENLALDWYAKEYNGGWQGVHCENSLWLTLFGICMWEAIFMSVDGVWWNEYQHAPSDLRTDTFAVQRAPVIQRLCAQIRHLQSSEELREYIALKYWQYYPQRCVGISWSNWSVDVIQDVAVCLGSNSLASLCEILANDYSHWHSGLPDLCLYRVEAEDMPRAFQQRFCTCAMHSEGESHRTSYSLDDDVIVIDSDVEIDYSSVRNKIQSKSNTELFQCHQCGLHIISCLPNATKLRLVEVKGPRDRLSAQQMAWLQVLSSIMHVEICFVRYDEN